MVRPDAGARGAARLSGPFVLTQKNTQFQPRVLIVPVGADVSFPNLDPFHHHVFSFSKTKTFELKQPFNLMQTYGSKLRYVQHLFFCFTYDVTHCNKASFQKKIYYFGRQV
jgi:hypothetical protein